MDLIQINELEKKKEKKKKNHSLYSKEWNYAQVGYAQEYNESGSHKIIAIRRHLKYI